MKKFLILFSLAVIGGGAWFYFRSDKEDALQYQTIVLERGEVVQTVTATGTLNPVLNVQVGSQVSGIIQKLYADFNSEVKAGDIVAQLDPATFQATVNQSEGDLASAEAGLNLARLNLKRQQELADNSLSTIAELDDSRAKLQQAEATVKIRRAQVEKAKVDLGRCTIMAPISGVVISRNVDVGQTVAASLSAPVIFMIANDLQKMQINTNVAEADVGQVEVGQKVDFFVDAFSNRTFHGIVKQVRNSPITVQNVVTYDTIIEVNNDDLKLKPGMTANVTIIVTERHDVLKLPNAALRFRPPASAGLPSTPRPNQSATATPSASRPGGPGGPGGNRGSSAGRGGPGGRRPGGFSPRRTVYVLVDSKLTPVQVRTGITDGVFTEILEATESAENADTAEPKEPKESKPTVKAGDSIVTSVITPAATTPAGPPTGGGNPFGGGGGGGGRRF